MASKAAEIRTILRERLNRQFLLGARNQAFLTEYVSGMETVKSLQMEPQLGSRFGDYLSSYLSASFNTSQLANSCNVVANKVTLPFIAHQLPRGLNVDEVIQLGGPQTAKVA